MNERHKQESNLNSSEHNLNKGITELKNNTVDVALIAYSVIGILLDISELIRAFESGLKVSFFIHTFVFFSLLLLTLCRNRLALETKIYAFNLLVFISFSADLHNYGFWASSKVLIVVIPVFSSFILPFRKSILIFLAFMLSYIFYAFLFSNGVLHCSADVSSYINSSKSWLVDGTFLVLVSMGLLIVGQHFTKALNKNKTKTESLGKEYQSLDNTFKKTNQELTRPKEKAEKNEYIFKAIFDNSLDAIGVSKQGINLFFNEAYVTLFGYESPDEIIGKPILELIKPSERSRIENFIQNRTIRENVPTFYETIGLKKNGKEFPFEINVGTYSLKNEIFTIATIRDITKRNLAEKALKESEGRFRLLAENSTDMISRHTPEGLYLYASPVCEQLLGYSANELIGRSAYDFIQQEDINKVEQSHTSILNERIVYTVVFRVKRKDGQLVWLETTSHTINDPISGAILEIHAASRDVTERKRAEDALKDSEEKFTRIFDRAPVLIAISDFETGVFIDVNTFSINFSEFSREEVIGFSSAEIGWISPENRKLLADTVLKNNRIEGLEMSFNTKSGKEVFGIVNGEKMMFHGKECLLTITTDITERIHTEQALRKSEALYYNIFEHSPIGLQFYQPDGLLVKLNNECLAIFGVVDILDIKDWNLFNDPNVTDELKEAMLRGESVRFTVNFDFELVKSLNLYRTTRSGIRIFNVTISSLSIGYISQIVDITEHILAETELVRAKEKAEESEKRFSNAIAATSDAVWEWDLTTNTTFYSPRWFEMLGYENNEFEMNIDSWKTLTHPDDLQSTLEKINESIHNSSPYAIEFRMQTKEGDWKWILGRGSLVHKNEKGEPSIMSGTNTDITAQKQMDFELEQYRNHLEKLVKEKTEEIEATSEEIKASSEEIRATNEVLYQKNKIIERQNLDLNNALAHIKETQTQLFQTEKLASLGVLTAGVAHEINNPLNYIMGAYEGLSMLYKKSGRVDEDENIPLLLSSLKTGVDRVSNIVSGLNQFSRNTDTVNEKCELQNIIENCLVILNNQYKNRIEIKRQYATEPITLLGNVGKLHQVFVNIIGNAIQSIETKGIISIDIKSNKTNALIEISDTGVGINPKDLSKITEPFFTTKNPGKGTGLGLSITYSIIKEHRGNIEFKSELNQGTQVIITLPLTL